MALLLPYLLSQALFLNSNKQDLYTHINAASQRVFYLSKFRALWLGRQFPSENQPVLSENQPVLSENQPVLSENESVPSQNESVPSEKCLLQFFGTHGVVK